MLKELIKVLDDPDNDIYIHFDSKIGDIDYTQFKITHFSDICFIDKRVDVAWGRVSLVEATLNLLEEAVKGNYNYYHLLSGVDLPIKSNEYIKNFFSKEEGMEFIGISSLFNESTYLHRVGRYHLIDGNKVRKSRLWRKLNDLLLFLQTIFNIRHIRNVERIKGGPEWFSITNDLAKDLLKQKKDILENFKYTLCSDELFIQTFVWNSDCKYKLYNNGDEYNGCMRMINWERGNPYTWEDKDFDELMQSPYLFARKFSEKDMKIVKRICDAISKGNN